MNDYPILLSRPNLAYQLKDKVIFSIIRPFLKPSLRGKKRLIKFLAKYHKHSIIKPYGFNFKIAIGSFNLCHNMIYDEIFIEKVYDLNKVNFVPEVIIDCGAHIGLFTTLANNYFPSGDSFAFEPNPENLDYLKDNCKQNSLSITIVPAAVSNYDGTANSF